jgi:uncharacterized protein (DUF1501 family)
MTTRKGISRRQALRTGLLGLAGAGLGPRFLLRTTSAHAATSRVLVTLFQRGAVDGLSMVVPHGESRYYALRSSIAIPRPGSSGGALDLDGFFGLHPAMAALLPFYAAGQLAIIHACGSPDPSRSHFEAQDYMETGVPGDKTITDGWLNRHLQATSSGVSQSLRAVALSNTTPRALAGSAPTYAAPTLVGLELGRGQQGAIARAALARMYGGRGDLLGRTVQETLANYAVFTELGAGGYVPANGAIYPDSVLGAQLREVAQAIKAKIGVEIAFLESGGWDTHSLQGGSQGVLANLLGDLADSLAAFCRDLEGQLEDVCFLTMSEFGRTAAENGSGGCDHGHGTAMLVLGGNARGGRVYGDWPGLGPADLYEGRDLAVTTDFRDLFAEIAGRHLGTPDVARLFPGYPHDPSRLLGVMA